MSEPELFVHAERFVDLYIGEMVYFPAFERLRRAQHMGHYTCILSNSPSFLVRFIAVKFGVDGYRSSEYGVDKDQRLCQILKILQGEDKARSVEELLSGLNIQKEVSIAYSDSYLDLPFLLSAGTAVAVNPDRKLTRIAQKMGWEKI